jgi:hypothetical protein
MRCGIIIASVPLRTIGRAVVSPHDCEVAKYINDQGLIKQTLRWITKHLTTILLVQLSTKPSSHSARYHCHHHPFPEFISLLSRDRLSPKKYKKQSQQEGCRTGNFLSPRWWPCPTHEVLRDLKAMMGENYGYSL